jgi:hypothetical protein
MLLREVSNTVLASNLNSHEPKAFLYEDEWSMCRAQKWMRNGQEGNGGSWRDARSSLSPSQCCILSGFHNRFRRSTCDIG